MREWVAMSKPIKDGRWWCMKCGHLRFGGRA